MPGRLQSIGATVGLANQRGSGERVGAGLVGAPVFVASSEDGSMLSWDVTNGSRLVDFDLPVENAWALDVGPDGRSVAVGTTARRSQAVTGASPVFDTGTGERVWRLQGHSDQAFDVGALARRHHACVRQRRHDRPPLEPRDGRARQPTAPLSYRLGYRCRVHSRWPLRRLRQRRWIGRRLGRATPACRPKVEPSTAWPSTRTEGVSSRANRSDTDRAVGRTGGRDDMGTYS